MKKSYFFLIAGLLSLHSLTALADPIHLDTLNCTAVNGGTLYSYENVRDAVYIRARFGLVQGQYAGKILTLSSQEPSTFELVGRQGEKTLVVSASIDPEYQGLQQVGATIAFAEAAATVVAARCSILVTDIR